MVKASKISATSMSAGRTPAIANAASAERRVAGPGSSGISGGWNGPWPSPPPSSSTGFCRMSRARSAVVTITAPPQSSTGQQSSTRSGAATNGEASTASIVSGSFFGASGWRCAMEARRHRDGGEMLGLWCRSDACAAARSAHICPAP